MPRLLLINPANTRKGLGNIRSTTFPPLNLPYIAALTPGHYEIEVIDEIIEPFEYREADIVGITAYTASVNRAYEISTVYGKKGVPTIMGGIHVSMMPDEAQKYCSSVVIGEAESVWPTVLKDFEAGCLKKQYFGKQMKLADLPIPRRDVLKNEYYKSGSIQTSRGCPMDCSFCSVTAFNGRRFRRRPVEAVISELEKIPQKRIFIADDNLTGYGRKDLQWTRDFFKRIIEKKINKHFIAQASLQIGENPDLLRLAFKAGLKMVFIGMESINAKAVQSYGKNINLKRLKENRYISLIQNIREARILVLGAFIVGGDDDDITVFKNTLDFINGSHIDILQVSKLTPLPGTRLFETMNRESRILNQNYPSDWKDYRFTRTLYNPSKMTIEEVYEGYGYLKRKYFSRWQTIKRTANTFLTTKSVVSAIMAYQLNKSYYRAFLDSDNYDYYGRSEMDNKYSGRTRT
jgi:radical SAM superfamily enzyme YgiQ (UPF0313 family)